MAPGDASLYIDGRGAGSANQFSGPDQFVALTPGLHRIEVRKSGFRPARAAVETTGSASSSGSESDSLTADIPPGGGYFVVPTR